MIGVSFFFKIKFLQTKTNIESFYIVKELSSNSEAGVRSELIRSLRQALHTVLYFRLTLPVTQLSNGLILTSNTGF